MEKLLTIVIPTYNTEGVYFERCISSLDALVDEAIEVVVVDDGSMECNLQQLKHIASSSSCELRFYAKDNGGQNSARQYGIEQSTGKYVFFLDSDDYIDGTEFAKVLDCLEEHEPNILYFNYDVVNLNGDTLERHERWQSHYCDIDIRQGIINSNSLSFAIYRVSSLKTLGFGLIQGIKIGEDLSSAISILIGVGEASSLGAFPYKYVKRPSSVTRRPSKDSVADIRFAFDELLRRIGPSLEQYHEEIEWMAILHVLAWGGLRAVRAYGGDAEIQAEFFEWMALRFPDWRQNRRMLKERVARSPWFKLVITGHWGLVAAVVGLYDQVKTIHRIVF